MYDLQRLRADLVRLHRSLAPDDPPCSPTIQTRTFDISLLPLPNVHVYVEDWLPLLQGFELGSLDEIGRLWRYICRCVC